MRFARRYAAMVLCALAASVPLAGRAQLQTIYSIGVSLDGLPGGLTPAPDGSFYGALAAGGRLGLGSVFHLSPDGRRSESAFDFAAATTNQSLQAGPIAALTNGLIYGVFTDFPATGSTNLFYRIGTNGAGFTILQGLPAFYTSLRLASDNRFYLLSGPRLDRFDLDGSAYTTIAINLNWTRLVEGSDGRLYGATGNAIQRMNKDGSQLITLTNLTRGATALLWGGDGRLYGTEDNFPNGQVAFGLAADGTGLQTLGSLDSGGMDSSVGSLVEAVNAKLYLTFAVGPQSASTRIASIDKAGGVNTVLDLPPLYANNPGEQFITAGSDGRLYGSASQGGTNGSGAIYILDPGSGQLTDGFEWGGSPGSFIQSALSLGSDGWLYGSARQGGRAGGGMIFRLKPDGSRFGVLKDFTLAGEGFSPRGGVTEGTDGILYGTTEAGGSTGGGTIFKLNQDGTGFAVLAQFGSATGTNPVAQVLQGGDGALYGTCLAGGATATNGTLWKIQTNGTSITVLKAFAADGSEGRHPFAPLLEAADGLLYGVTELGGSANKGVIFKIAKDGSNFQILRNLLGFGDAAVPDGRLLQLPDGTLIGTSTAGGSAGLGSIFRLSTNGSNYRVLYSFTSTNSDGRVPVGGLVPAGDGSLLGTTRFGGGAAVGTVFQINPDGTGYTILERFSLDPQSPQEPWAALTPGPAGVFFGASSLGGLALSGTIFQFQTKTPGPVPLSFAVNLAETALVVSWPQSSSAVQLQVSTKLSDPSAWQAAPGAPALSNGIFTQTIPFSGNAGFLRLLKP